MLRAASSLGGLAGLAPLSIFSRSYSLVPMVIESTSRGERAFDIYSRLLRWVAGLRTQDANPSMPCRG